MKVDEKTEYLQSYLEKHNKLELLGHIAKLMETVKRETDHDKQHKIAMIEFESWLEHKAIDEIRI